MTTPDSQIKDVPPGEPPQGKPPDDLHFLVRSQAREIAALNTKLDHEARMHRDADELYCAANGRASFLDEDIEVLTSEKSTLVLNLNDTQTKLSAAQKAMLAKDQQIATVTSAKGGLEKSVKTLEAQLTDTRTNLAAAERTILTRDGRITTLTDANGGLEKKVKKLSEDLTTATTDRDSWKDRAQRRLGLIITFGLALAAYVGLHAYGVI